MSRLKKLGIPKEIEPTLELLDRIADGDDIEYDVVMVTKNLALMQYYLKGKLDGMKIKTDENRKIAEGLIEEAQKELKYILAVITGTV